MDEANLENSLELYKTQLSQVNQAIVASGANDDLVRLQSDLQELISLTEASLLSLKKSNLLKSIDVHPDSSADRPSTTDSEADAEYAAFQAAIAAEDPENSQACASFSETKEENRVLENPQQSDTDSASDIFKDIIGTKCRAPYTHEWGAKSYYNAMVIEVDAESVHTDCLKVKVMFCNPTHVKMVPCKYFLDGNCRFSEDQCRYTHGSCVAVEDLQEFLEPNFSCLRVGSKCMAKYDDDIWYKSTVVDELENHQYKVVYESYKGIHTLDIEDIFPLEEDSSSEEHSSSEEDSDSDSTDPVRFLNEGINDSDSEEDALPVFLWRPPKTTQALGEWEQHTRGIASKLMAKMGYVVGQGLGKDGEGRAEPVPIQLIPKGKSLDKIMELKEIAGDRDVFDVMKKIEKKKKKLEAKEIKEKEKPKVEESNVFDFINKKLGAKKGNIRDLIHRHPTQPAIKQRHINEQDLKEKSDRSLNVQLLKTNEEIKSAQKELLRLRNSLRRNELRDKGMAAQLQKKILSLEQYIQKLQTSESTIQQHQSRRSDHKKLTVF